MFLGCSISGTFTSSCQDTGNKNQKEEESSTAHRGSMMQKKEDAQAVPEGEKKASEEGEEK